MSAVFFEDREDPGRAASAALAALVHIALAILLVYGIRWQTRSPGRPRRSRRHRPTWRA